MSDFLKLGGSQPSSVEMLAQKEAIMNNVRTEIAHANAQLLMNNMNERCFKACITKPGTSLSSSEETCLTRCSDRFMEAFNITSRMYITRLSKERANEQDKLE